MIKDKLTAVVELPLSFFDVIPSLFGGFLDFLSALLSFTLQALSMEFSIYG